MESVVCSQGWEALRSDCLEWLLDERRPNLHWRVLVDLVGRPVDSPAVRRARGGANACDPVATLLSDLQPDGSWATDVPFWAAHEGPGWRLVAAVQWGADPEDPRLHAAAERLLETAPGEGGLALSEGEGPDPIVTARALQALSALGWGRHGRVQEWFAWFDATRGWVDEPPAAVAVLAASAAVDRRGLMERAVAGLEARLVASGGNNLSTFGHPNFHRTDLVEILAAFAVAGVEFRSAWRGVLVKLQHAQDRAGRWDRVSLSPSALGLSEHNQPSRWVTLKATKVLLTYAVVAELPRVFPSPPSS